MQVMAIATGLVSGALGGVVWHALARRADTGPLLSALGRSLRAVLGDEGHFLREYGLLLRHAGGFVLWHVLGLAGALTPALVAAWLLWPGWEGMPVSLVVAYSVAAIGAVIWARRCARGMNAAGHRNGLSISDSQYFLLQVAQGAPWLMQRCAACETRLLRRRLDATRIDRPIFVAGLARSGTTMLLELLSQADGAATHRYRDFPFLMTPYFWNRFVELFGVRGEATERPHQDGIRITLESPEAYEEPIWQRYFPDAHRPVECHVLDAERGNHEFEQVFADHLRKMLLVRGGRRYVSKGNYNVTRIEYLAALFPDARFVVPIRHPVPHVASLVRQHQLFCDYAQQDERVAHYLAAAGHFEFGPHRVPISVRGSGRETLAAWDAGDEHRGYALQWAAVYGYVLDVLGRSPELAERVMVVRYEDLCGEARGQLAGILRHVELAEEGAALLDRLDHIKVKRDGIGCDATTEAVWGITADVAAAFGYQPDGCEARGRERARWQKQLLEE